ncbi:MAG: hypothetical protein ABSF74_09420 [Dehalococcoidia bacterium]
MLAAIETAAKQIMAPVFFNFMGIALSVKFALYYMFKPPVGENILLLPSFVESIKKLTHQVFIDKFGGN